MFKIKWTDNLHSILLCRIVKSGKELQMRSTLWNIYVPEKLYKNLFYWRTKRLWNNIVGWFSIGNAVNTLFHWRKLQRVEQSDRFCSLKFPHKEVDKYVEQYLIFKTICTKGFYKAINPSVMSAFLLRCGHV